MREILFRGKRLDNGAWVEGYYVRLYDCKGNETYRIYPGNAETDCGDYYPEWFEIDPATVGQYVGLTGKNGTKIFEGDIVRYDDEPAVVEWNDCDAMFVVRSLDGTNWETNFSVICGVDLEVIGNVHDNPPA